MFDTLRVFFESPAGMYTAGGVLAALLAGLVVLIWRIPNPQVPAWRSDPVYLDTYARYGQVCDRLSRHENIAFEGKLWIRWPDWAAKAEQWLSDVQRDHCPDYISDPAEVARLATERSRLSAELNSIKASFDNKSAAKV